MAMRRMRIGFPLGGFNRETPYRQQKPYETYDCLNVIPSGVLESRERGGSRWGTIATHGASLGSNFRFVNSMTLSLGDGFTTLSDTFIGDSLASEWSQSSWVTGLPSVSDNKAVSEYSSGYTGAEKALDGTKINWDTGGNSNTIIEIYIVPQDGAHQGTYEISVRHDSALFEWAARSLFSFTIEGTTGVYSGTALYFGEGAYVGQDGTITTVTGGTDGSAEPGWLSLHIGDDGDVRLYWRGTQIAFRGSYYGDAAPGDESEMVGITKTGFAMTGTVEDQRCQTSIFRVQYHGNTFGTSIAFVEPSRSMIVAGIGGDVYYEKTYGEMAIVTSGLTTRDDVTLIAAQNGQKLYIADYGDVRAKGTNGVISGSTLDSATFTDWTDQGISTDDDVCVITNGTGSVTDGNYAISSVAAGAVTLGSAPGDGNCTFRIERAPKIFDPSANTLTQLTATRGSVPVGCPIAWRHLGSLMLAGAEVNPTVWYKSRQYDEQDWDYSDPSTDAQRAVAGNSSDAGVPGTAITAGAPHGDDYSILGCRNQIWRMRGDPAYGGQLDNLSYEIGIVGPNAWCIGPQGEFVFLSLDGIYMLQSGGNTYPESVSREKMPLEFEDLDTIGNTISLDYDTTRRGVHVFISPNSYNDQKHFFMDWKRKTFWPVKHSSEHEPLCTCVSPGGSAGDVSVVLACRDGVLRRYDRTSQTDDGTNFSSFVDIGPIPLAQDSRMGRLLMVEGILSEGSGNVTWSLHPGDTFELATKAASVDSGTWSSGQNANVRPACRGQAAVLKLTGTPGSEWVFEHAIGAVLDAGRRKLT